MDKHSYNKSVENILLLSFHAWRSKTKRLSNLLWDRKKKQPYYYCLDMRCLPPPGLVSEHVSLWCWQYLWRAVEILGGGAWLAEVSHKVQACEGFILVRFACSLCFLAPKILWCHRSYLPCQARVLRTPGDKNKSLLSYFLSVKYFTTRTQILVPKTKM